jgi:putative addiction module component (TIGR02574 family)
MARNRALAFLYSYPGLVFYWKRLKEFLSSEGQLEKRKTGLIVRPTPTAPTERHFNIPLRGIMLGALEAFVMATNPPIPPPIPPPGFDELSLDDQIDYVQSLWDRIAGQPDQVPLPEWHRQVIRQRIAEHDANPSEGRPWEEVRSEIRTQLTRRSSKG